MPEYHPLRTLETLRLVLSFKLWTRRVTRDVSRVTPFTKLTRWGWKGVKGKPRTQTDEGSLTPQFLWKKVVTAVLSTTSERQCFQFAHVQRFISCEVTSEQIQRLLFICGKMFWLYVALCLFNLFCVATRSRSQGKVWQEVNRFQNKLRLTLVIRLLFVRGSQVGCHRPLVCPLAFVSLLFVLLVSVSLRFLPYAGLLLPRPLSLCALLVRRKYWTEISLDNKQLQQTKLNLFQGVRFKAGFVLQRSFLGLEWSVELLCPTVYFISRVGGWDNVLTAWRSDPPTPIPPPGVKGKAPNANGWRFADSPISVKKVVTAVLSTTSERQCFSLHMSSVLFHVKSRRSRFNVYFLFVAKCFGFMWLFAFLICFA